MAVFVGKLGAEERSYEIFGEFYADNARAQDENVDVIMLDALMGGISVVAHSGADAGKLIGGDTGADATPADEHTALGFSVQDSPADGFGEIRIVGRILVESANVQNFVA